MNVLVVGSGKGSWEMRGQQLGGAIGARVSSSPSAEDWKWASVAVLIKRAGFKYAALARQFNVPIVWDAVDFWSQPWDNGRPEEQARQILKASLDAIRPALTIGATEAMAEAAGGVYLPHHSWRGLKPVKPQEHVKVVTYQGNPVYLGQWRPALVKACARRGWSFATAPDGTGDEPLYRSDILVAFRDGLWDGWMCREWKSGVKLVNAIAAGRPMVTQPGAAWREIDPPGWAVDSEENLEAALDHLTTLHARTLVYEACMDLAPRYTLPAVAESFRGILSRVELSCPA